MKTFAHKVLDQALFAELARGEFIDHSHNVIIHADNEDAISSVAQLLCDRVRKSGYSTSYLHAKHLVELLNKNGRRKVTRGLDHYDLICIDHLTMDSLTNLEIHQVLDLLRDRVMVGPVLFPTPYSMEELEKLFTAFRAQALFESLAFRSYPVDCPNRLFFPNPNETMTLNPLPYARSAQTTWRSL